MPETHSVAWNRTYYFRQLYKPEKKDGRHIGPSWMSQEDCPIRLRGYTEIVMGDIAPKLRKKIGVTIRRGYQLEKNTQLPWVLRPIEKHNDVAPIRIGYVGKTEFILFMPTAELAVDLQKELHALTVMTEVFSGQGIRARGTKVTCNISSRSDAKGKQAHLRSAFKELRPAIDDHMALWAREREKVAEWCANDKSVIRIPFDTHKDKANAK
ncbi:hypothetical protein MNBD_GAMMA15-1663 [hydrothermal vent metagenome]|uniref:Uncharacterized protein n=1 Tax=hydrothermal vent metagenome TaxID=652676 RepID=A0A3B0ZG34_9ZZZZ